MKVFSVERFKGDKPDGIGGTISEWVHHIYVNGYIDMLTGHQSDVQNAFITQSTHVLITDHANYDVITTDRIRGYEITYVDNPVGMDHHLEIYLKQVT